MNAKTAQNKISEKSKYLFGFAAFILAVAYLLTVFVLKGENQKKRPVESDIVQFKNFPKDIDIKTTLKNKSGTFDLVYKDSSIVLPPKVVQNFSVPYSMESRWESKTGDYQNLKWELDSKGVLYNITLNGFLPFSLVSLSVKNSYSLKNAKMDWSGKIQLPIILSPTDDVDVCVDVKSDKSFSFCHRLVGKKEGQIL